MTSATDQLTGSFAAKISPLLKKIENSDKKAIVSDFWQNHVAPYFTELHTISEGLDNNTLDYDMATQRTLKATQEVLKKGGETEDKLNDDEIIKEVKAYFRVVGAPYGLASKAVRHAFEKPGGYPGDYELLEFIYNDVPTSDKFGYCADMVFLNDDYARAVRSRKEMMKVILLEFFEERKHKKTSIFNIACGASRELREIFKEKAFCFDQPVTFTMIDKSPEALAFSEKELAHSPANVNYRFVNNSVYDYLKERDHYSKEFSGQDLIYSIGLADYIPADSLSQQIRFFFNLLNPGGRLVIAHKDSRNYIPLTPDWWADWTFFLRDEDEVVNLVKTSGIENYTLTVEREKNTNIIFFLNIQRD